ncbi:MAG: YnfA family protein [Anaerolineae bacterium]|nr:YnfA family protein [Anaerolineae bacterium]MDK1081773.1 YnfA family protein [Anaerolineae bacterium]MDK1118947.1 YnfA family protein [Anaerolineae bacterium]
MNTIRTISLLLIAGLAEIIGVYLIWGWIRNSRPAWWALLGIGALFVYGLTQTLQALNFGRVFSAYGGIFIVLALVWGWLVDGQTPDRWDWIGVSFALLGASIILWAPRP